MVVPDRREAIRLAVSLARPGDAVLVAGKGMKITRFGARNAAISTTGRKWLQALKEYHG